jgi:hypothetical protein
MQDASNAARILEPSGPAPAASIGEAVGLIRSAPAELLKDASWLETNLLLSLGLNNEILEEFPSHLYPWCGHGVKSWQYPNQFSKYLTTLAEQDISAYLEVGCRHGGTFIITVEYLRRFGNLKRAAAVDIVPSTIALSYVNGAGADICSYHIMSSASNEFKQSHARQAWDLCLIDGDHNWPACMQDFQAVKDNTRLIAMHDIVNSACPGVCLAWNVVTSVLPANRTMAFTEQYEEVQKRTGNNYLGIGLANLR